MEKREIQVGDSVMFKYDVEQCGKVEKIDRHGGWDGRSTIYYVRAFHGGCVDSIKGTVIELDDDDLFEAPKATAEWHAFRRSQGRRY